MKPYGLCKRVTYGYYDEGIIDRGGITHRLRKILDEAVDDHYNGYEDWLDKIDPFMCDCTLRPDIEYYLKKND